MVTPTVTQRMTEIAVVGAGAAGLAAAMRLAACGRKVTVLEARERVGGRIHTLRPPGQGPVELGAEFVHGRPPLLLSMLREAGLCTVEDRGTDLCAGPDGIAPCRDAEVFPVLDELPFYLDAHGDISFAEFLRRRRLPPQKSEAVRAYVESFNAADAERIGIAALARQQRAEEAIEGDVVARPAAGYGALVQWLTRQIEQAGGTILCGRAITRLEWQPGRVILRCASGETVTAKRVVVTLPLGVLQAGIVDISPPPRALLEAAARMATGTAARLTLRFRSAFWEHPGSATRFLFSQGTVPGTFWAPRPGTATLVAWLGGPQAAPPPDREAFAGRSLRALEQAFRFPAGSLEEELMQSWYHDWTSDPWSRGAYSYAPVGAVNCAEVMAEPVEDTLFFAGEHTDTTGHWGTVHGALGSGLRAAERILNLA